MPVGLERDTETGALGVRRQTERSVTRTTGAVLLSVLLIGTLAGPALALDRPITMNTSAPTTVTAGERATFQASVAADTGDPDITWDFDDGSTASGWLVSNTFEEPGQYSIIVVADSDGARARAAISVTVVPRHPNTTRTRPRR